MADKGREGDSTIDLIGMIILLLAGVAALTQMGMAAMFLGVIALLLVRLGGGSGAAMRRVRAAVWPVLLAYGALYGWVAVSLVRASEEGITGEGVVMEVGAHLAMHVAIGLFSAFWLILMGARGLMKLNSAEVV